MEYDDEERQALFLDRARKRSKVHIVEMVTPVANNEQLASFPNQKTLTKFIADVYKADARHTVLGLCGRCSQTWVWSAWHGAGARECTWSNAAGKLVAKASVS